MLANWIYNHPTWIVGSVIVGLFVLLSCIGLAIVQRLVPVRLRLPHNDIVGFTIAVVGVVYAVLLAFIAVATWETFQGRQRRGKRSKLCRRRFSEHHRL